MTDWLPTSVVAQQYATQTTESRVRCMSAFFSVR